MSVMGKRLVSESSRQEAASGYCHPVDSSASHSTLLYSSVDLPADDAHAHLPDTGVNSVPHRPGRAKIFARRTGSGGLRARCGLSEQTGDKAAPARRMAQQSPLSRPVYPARP